MDFELTKLLDDLGFTAEERVTAEALLTPRVEKVKKTFMAQSDYSKNMDLVRRLQADAKRKEELADNDMVAITNFQSKVAQALGVTDINQAIPKLNEFITNHSALTAREQAVVAELKKQAGEYGFEFKLPDGSTPNPNPNPNPAPRPNAAVDTSRFVTRDDVANDLRSTYPQVAAQIHDLSIQHQKLFGAPLENASELVALSMQSAQDAVKFRDPSREKTPQQIWAEKFNVAGKQQEIAEAGVQARINKAIEEDRIKRASQNGGSPVPNAGIPGSPVIGHGFKPVVDAGKVSQSGDAGRGVAAAMANFGTHYGNAN